MHGELTLIATFGRSGSTMLMHALSQHPQVLMWRAFPYEHRIAQYLAAAARSELPENLGPVQLGAANCIAAHPNDDVIRRALELATRESDWRQDPRAAALQVYAQIALHQGRQAGSIVENGHIIEKGLGVAGSLETLKLWPKGRAILLSRDPRSIFFSVKAFNKKRGFAAFGADRGDRVLFDNIVRFTRDARRHMAAQTPLLEIRYEDLVTAPEPAIRSVLTFCGLGVDAAGPVAAALFDQYPQAIDHMTCGARDGIARWRAEASDEERAMFAEAAESLAEIGYP